MSGDRSLTAYALQAPLARLEPADIRRTWMDSTPGGFANRCLPLLIANQSGWVLLNRGTVRVTWDGGPEAQDVTVESDTDEAELPQSHFGGGTASSPAAKARPRRRGSRRKTASPSWKRTCRRCARRR